MKYVLIFCLLFGISSTYADNSSSISFDTYNIVEKPVIQEENPPAYVDVEDLIVEFPSEKDEEIVNHITNITNQRDILGVLCSGTTGTILLFLSRIAYIWYKSKTGQLVVKKIKNDIQSLEDDIVDNIARITDIETGEEARKSLRNIQKRLLEIAADKLEPIVK